MDGPLISFPLMSVIVTVTAVVNHEFTDYSLAPTILRGAKIHECASKVCAKGAKV